MFSNKNKNYSKEENSSDDLQTPKLTAAALQKHTKNTVTLMRHTSLDSTTEPRHDANVQIESPRGNHEDIEQIKSECYEANKYYINSLQTAGLETDGVVFHKAQNRLIIQEDKRNVLGLLKVNKKN